VPDFYTGCDVINRITQPGMQQYNLASLRIISANFQQTIFVLEAFKNKL